MESKTISWKWYLELVLSKNWQNAIIPSILLAFFSSSFRPRLARRNAVRRAISELERVQSAREGSSVLGGKAHSKDARVYQLSPLSANCVVAVANVLTKLNSVIYSYFIITPRFKCYLLSEIIKAAFPRGTIKI